MYDKGVDDSTLLFYLQIQCRGDAQIPRNAIKKEDTL